MKYLSAIFIALAFSGSLQGQNDTSMEEEVRPGYWLIPKTKTQLKFGGYVKLDIIRDFNPIGSPDFFDVSQIPTDGSTGATTNLHAKETRLYLDTHTPTKIGNIRTYVEGDFYGSGSAFRLRHAFVEINDAVLAGQYWSNFMDENIIPASLDFEKPAAYAFARHAMLRYKHTFGDSYWAIALEQVSNKGQSPPEPGSYENPMPDITMRYRVTKDWGHIQLSGFFARVRYRTDAGDTQNISEYGLNLSGQINLFERDKIIYQGLHGPGIGRYRGDETVGLDGNNELEAIVGVAGTIGFQHYWSEAWSSLVVFNHGSSDPTAGEPPSNATEANYVAVNLLWHFVKNGFVGVEYLRGRREDISGDSGIANRLQCSVKYIFN